MGLPGSLTLMSGIDATTRLGRGSCHPGIVRAARTPPRGARMLQHVSANQIWLGLLVLRVSVGVTMIAHGYNHIYRGGKIKGTAGWFASLGMKPCIFHAWLASITELVAGAALLARFLTPFAAGGAVRHPGGPLLPPPPQARVLCVPAPPQ